MSITATAHHHNMTAAANGSRFLARKIRCNRRQACLEVLGENQPAGRTHVRRARLVRRARMAALGAFLVHTLNIARARACRLARDGKPYREANNNRSNTKTQSAKKRAKHGVRMASPLAPPPPDFTLGAVLGGLGFGLWSCCPFLRGEAFLFSARREISHRLHGPLLVTVLMRVPGVQ
jgi:hypothetical protein